MSLQALTWAWKQELPTTVKIVLLALADHANPHALSWVGVPKIKAKTCLCERAVRNSLGVLKQRGLIVEAPRSGKTKRYRLAITTKPAAAAPGRSVLAADDPKRQVPAGDKCDVELDAWNPGTACSPSQHVVPVSPAPRAPKPSTTSTEPKKNHGARRAPHDEVVEEEAFEEFWQLYPRRQGRGSAMRAWNLALRKVDGDPEVIIVGLKAQLHLFAAPNPGGSDYRPFPATWLNDERWRDGEEAGHVLATPGPLRSIEQAA
jgi:hypothetical protein